MKKKSNEFLDDKLVRFYGLCVASLSGMFALLSILYFGISNLFSIGYLIVAIVLFIFAFDVIKSADGNKNGICRRREK